MIILIKISKQEANILNKEFGVNFGAYGIYHTYTRYKKYYLCETSKNLKLLNKIRSGYGNIQGVKKDKA